MKPFVRHSICLSFVLSTIVDRRSDLPVLVFVPPQPPSTQANSRNVDLLADVFGQAHFASEPSTTVTGRPTVETTLSDDWLKF